MMPGLNLSLQFGRGVKADNFPLSKPRLQRLITASLPAGCKTASLTLRVVGTLESKQLNRSYRNIDKATNILTFAYTTLPEICADLVLCLPYCRTEAREQGKPLDQHLAHMVVHGTLHASGLDHEEELAAQAMESLETMILRRFRIPNPYKHATV
jgi:probable rRNA maturation factor